MRVLCLDIEGGHGGSSRSLEAALCGMDRQDVSLEVICRRDGGLVTAYREQGIGAKVEPTMPKVTSVPKFSRNLLLYTQFLVSDWPSSAAFRNRLIAQLEKSDLIHLNHENLFLLARWIRRHRPSTKIVMHVRTQPWDSAFARWQARTASRCCDALIFITENEYENFQRLAGRNIAGRIIYNPVRLKEAVNKRENKGGLTLNGVVLSNYSYLRGIDRLISVGKHLKQSGARNVRFTVAGDMRLSRSLPGALGRIGRAGGTLADYATAEGVGDMFTFLGHVADPETVLAAGDVLLKPSRENNPWGRDILEGLAAGLPVASVGTYDRFVETNETGFLQPQFDAGGLGDWLVELAGDPEKRQRLGLAGRRRVAELCDAETQGNKLRDLWAETVAA